MRRNHRISNWIFVTGVIRSGTTFVGDILSHGLSVDYLHEPFHGGYTQPGHVELLPRYVSSGDTSEHVREYNDQLDRLFRYQLDMRTSRYDGDSRLRKLAKSVVGSRGPFYLRIAKVNPFASACVIKDPVARLVTGHLYRRYDVKPVIVMKHPVSLAASLERVKWYPELEEYRRDNALRRDFFAGDDAFFERSWPNRLLESMGHWRATYKFLLDEAERYGDWTVVVHEDLSADPQTEFRRLFDNVGLEFSASAARKVERLTGSKSPTERAGRVQDFRRDSSKIFETRRQMVPHETRQQIFDIVHDVALRVYTRESFDID